MELYYSEVGIFDRCFSLLPTTACLIDGSNDL